jgi:transcriptional regulator with XRE-family HTH domain
MNIGERIRVLREARELTQGDIEKRTFLKRSYLSRVENGHTVPSIETLEKIARSLNISMYQFFYEGDKPVDEGMVSKRAATLYGNRGKEIFVLDKFRQLLGRMEDRERALLLVMAQRMATAGPKGTSGVAKRRKPVQHDQPGGESEPDAPASQQGQLNA